MHRRHDQFHKRSSGQMHDTLLDAIPLKRRGDYGVQAPATDLPVSHGEDNAYAQKPKKPKHKSKCKPNNKYEWVKAPKQETPVVYETPAPVEPAPVVEAPVEQAPVEEAPVVEAPAPAPEEYKVEEPVKEEYKQEQQAAPSTGKTYGVTYSPFAGQGQGEGGCIPKAQIETDLRDIATKFDNVRFYSPECNILDIAGPICKETGLKMIVGTYAKDASFSDSYKDLGHITEWGAKDDNWKCVSLVVVGNEALFQKFCSADALGSHISDCKGKLKGAGYQGPVTTAEITGTMKGASALCNAIDVIGVNIHPYFDGGASSSTAGQFMGDQIKIAAECCPGKDVYVLEAGWPKGGNPNGNAHASDNDQSQAVGGMKGACANNGGRCCWFSYNDESWKPAGPTGVENHFGLKTLFSGVADQVSAIGDKIGDKIEEVTENIGNAVGDIVGY